MKWLKPRGFETHQQQHLQELQRTSTQVDLRSALFDHVRRQQENPVLYTSIFNHIMCLSQTNVHSNITNKII